MVPPFLKFCWFFYFPGTLLFDVLWYFLDFLGISFLIFHSIFLFVSFYFIHGIYILYVPSAPQEFSNTLLSDTWYLRFDFQISFFFIILHRYFFLIVSFFHISVFSFLDRQRFSFLSIQTSLSLCWQSSLIQEILNDSPGTDNAVNFCVRVKSITLCNCLNYLG